MTRVGDDGRPGRSITPWPLGLAARLTRPELSLSFAVALVGFAYFGVSGAWLPGEYSHHFSSSLQITGMGLTYALMLSYLTGFFIYTSKKTLDFVAELRPLFIAPAAETLVAGLNRLDPFRYAVATAAGLVLGSFNISWDVVSEMGSEPNWPIDLSMVLGSVLVWVFAAQVIYSRSHNALLLSRLGRGFLEVDLFRMNRIEALGRIGILDLLLVMGALALTPLQALDAEFRSYNYLFAFLVALPAGLFLLVSPMWGVHGRLREAKSHALADVESRIAGVGRDVADPALTQLNALIARRSYLQSVNTWPMNLRGVSRVAFYLVIPPLAWVAAALVEILVETVLRAS